METTRKYLEKLYDKGLRSFEALDKDQKTTASLMLIKDGHHVEIKKSLFDLANYCEHKDRDDLLKYAENSIDETIAQCEDEIEHLFELIDQLDRKEVLERKAVSMYSHYETIYQQL